jgi:hypothetical protein
MIFKHEVYIGSSELSLISDPTRALKAIVFKQDCTVGGFQGGLRGRNSTGGTCAEEGGRDACFNGGNRHQCVNAHRWWSGTFYRCAWEPSFGLSQEATVGDVPSAPGFSDLVDLGDGELGLLGFPQVPLLLAGWGHVKGGV